MFSVGFVGLKCSSWQVGMQFHCGQKASSFAANAFAWSLNGGCKTPLVLVHVAVWEVAQERELASLDTSCSPFLSYFPGIQSCYVKAVEEYILVCSSLFIAISS